MGQQQSSPFQAGYRPPPPTPPPRPPMPARSNVESMTTPPLTNAETGFQPGHQATPGMPPITGVRPQNWIGKGAQIQQYPVSSYGGSAETPLNLGGQQIGGNPAFDPLDRPGRQWESGATPNIRSRIETPPQLEIGRRYMQIPSAEAAMGGDAHAYPIPGSGGFEGEQPKPSERHINHLLENPHLADHFDQKFGQGAAAQHLNGGSNGGG